MKKILSVALCSGHYFLGIPVYSDTYMMQAVDQTQEYEEIILNAIDYYMEIKDDYKETARVLSADVRNAFILLLDNDIDSEVLKQSIDKLEMTMKEHIVELETELQEDKEAILSEVVELGEMLTTTALDEDALDAIMERLDELYDELEDIEAFEDEYDEDFMGLETN